MQRYPSPPWPCASVSLPSAGRTCWDSQGFFTYSFAPDRGGSSGFGQVETPETKPGQGPQGPAAQGRRYRRERPDIPARITDGARTTDGGRDKSLRQGQTSSTSPALNDAALEEFTDGGEWVDMPDQIVQSEIRRAMTTG